MELIEVDISGEREPIISFALQGYTKYSEKLDTYVGFAFQAIRQGKSEEEKQFVRRYSEFEWLHMRISMNHPHVIIPALPTKHAVTQLERFSDAFLKKRHLGFMFFLEKIADHPILSHDEDFCVFISYEQQAFRDYMKGNPVDRQKSSLFSSKPRSSSKPPSDDIFYVKYNKLEQMQGIFQRFEKVSSRICAELKTTKSILEENGRYLSKWAERESQFGSALNLTIQAFSDTWYTESKHLPNLISYLEFDNFAFFNQYTLYFDVVMHTIQHRTSEQVKLQQLQNKMTEHRDKMEKCPSSDKMTKKTIIPFYKKTFNADEYRTKLAATYDQMKVDENTLHDALHQSEEKLHNSLELLEISFTADVRVSLVAFSQSYIDYYNVMVSSWNRSLSSIRAYITSESHGGG